MPNPTRRRWVNLPEESTTFVGRSSDLHAVGQLLASARLVTLVGVPGVGKTRLALRVAGEIGHRFPGGVWFVELEAVRDSALIAHTIAHAVGLREDAGGDPLTLICEFLSGRKALLILDNCEHLTPACAEVVATLLRSSRRLRILVTSRHVLRIAGEYLWHVEPLPADREPDAGSVGQAVELFVRRASVEPTFRLTSDNLAQVVAVCRRLDGIPLAIELAAARLRTMSVEELLSGLGRRFELLGRWSAGHRTALRTAFDWSYGLCEPAERTLWARLSIFVGSFDLQAVEDICAGNGIDAGEVVDLLDALTGKSMISATMAGSTARYRMLETLRRYGREKLGQQSATARLMERYTQQYLLMAETAERQWFGPGQTALLDALESEHHDLRGALHALDAPQHAERAQRLAGALWFYWIFAGRIAEGRLWLDRALALSSEPTRPRARALWADSLLAGLEGNLSAGQHLAEDACTLAGRLGDVSTLTRALARLATAAVYRGDPEAAIGPCMDAIIRNSTAPEPDDVAEVFAHFALGMARLAQGDLTGAAQACGRADQVCQARRDHLMRAVTLNILARIALQAGDLPPAAAHIAEVLRATTAPPSRATAIEQLAWVACACGDHRDAAALLGAAHHVWETYRLTRYVQTAYFQGWHRDCRSRVASALGEREFDAEFRRGAQLGVDDIIGYADRRATISPVSSGPAESGSV